MQYRKMGSLDWEVSALGFGAMRLPVMKNWRDIDEEKAIKMIRYAIDHGVNYVDTAWLYHEGEAEKVVGKALKEGYREKVKLVTKSPIWLVKNREDFHYYFNKQIEKLDTGYIDIYLLHGLNGVKWDKVKKLGLLKEMEELKKQGKIRHIGFSFHGSYGSFIEIIDSYDWDVTLIQYNYLDTDYEVTTKGLDHAYSKNIAIAVMEPLRGGKLAQSNENIENILKNAPMQRSLIEWSFQFIWNHPGVCTILSGMSSLQQVKDNVEYAGRAKSNHLTADDLRVIRQLKEVYTEKIRVMCTNCKYCMPCKQGVDIPENLALMNHAVWEGEVQEWMQNWYNDLSSEDILTDWHGKGKASLCTECGDCIASCPQNIEIPAELRDVQRLFEQGVAVQDL